MGPRKRTLDEKQSIHASNAHIALIALNYYNYYSPVEILFNIHSLNCARISFVIVIAGSCRNRKLKVSTAPTQAKSREPAYSHALVQNIIDRQRVRSRESGRPTALCRLFLAYTKIRPIY